MEPKTIQVVPTPDHYWQAQLKLQLRFKEFLAFISKTFWSKKIIEAPKIFGPKSFVKIWSVTAEIFMIWANFARTNVSWTNVTMTVDIC